MSELQFEDFPNEVILTIFSFLDVKDLIQCVKVSKRVRAICHDDSLWNSVLWPGISSSDMIGMAYVASWKKINLYFKTIPAEFINYILIYGSCKYLSLWSADLIGNMNLNQKSPLKYLDLNFCKANDDVLNNLISACDSLEKLSLRNLTLNGKMIKAISENGKTLQVLNLEGCCGLILDRYRISSHNFNRNLASNQVVPGILEPIAPIIRSCNELVEVNFGSTGLSFNSISFLADNLTTKVQRLSLSDLEFLRDPHIECLLPKCTKITKLDLKRTSITEKSAKRIAFYLRSILEELDVSYTKIKNTIPELAAMPKLKILNCRGILKPEKIQLLKQQFPNLSINEDYFHFANSDETFHPRDGFWDIKAQQFQFKGALKQAIQNSI